MIDMSIILSTWLIWALYWVYDWYGHCTEYMIDMALYWVHDWYGLSTEYMIDMGIVLSTWLIWAFYWVHDWYGLSTKYMIDIMEFQLHDQYNGHSAYIINIMDVLLITSQKKLITVLCHWIFIKLSIDFKDCTKGCFMEDHVLRL